MGTARVGIGPTRAWAEVRRLLEEAGLDDAVRARALDTFARLARAEAAAHGVEPDDGALPRGRRAGCDRGHRRRRGGVGLARAGSDGGVDDRARWRASGARSARRHPGARVPRSWHLLSEAEAPVVGGTAPYEMTTPTGAALLATLADEFGLLPPMRIEQTGVGAGGRDPVEVPNIVRVVVGETSRARRRLSSSTRPTSTTSTRGSGRRSCPADGGRRGRRVADPDPDEEGPAGAHAVGPGRRRERRGGPAR